MFGSRALAGNRGSGGGKSLDVPVAALAGLAVAFLAFAMPAGLLADMVVASGLPNLIAAAEPPLGFKARIGVGAAGAVVVFSITFLVLRWLDGFGARRAEAADDDVFRAEAPRLRRRDYHPDAPARQPLQVHELGEPDLVLDQVAPAPRPLRKEPVLSNPDPVWSEPPAPPAPEPEPEPHFARDFDPEPRREPDADQAAAYALSQYRWSDDPPESDLPADDHWVDEPPVAAEPEPEIDVPEPLDPAAFAPPRWSPEPSAPAGRPSLAEFYNEPSEPVERESLGEPQWSAEPAAPVEPASLAEPQYEDEPPVPVERISFDAPQWGAEPAEPVEPVEPVSLAEPQYEDEPPGPAERISFDAPQWNDAPMEPAEPASFTEPQWGVEPSDLVEPASFAEPQGNADPCEPAEPAPVAETDHRWPSEAPEPWPIVREPEVEAEPEPAAPPPQPGSIAELMERLEQGLARRRSTPPLPSIPAARPVAEPAPSAHPDPADDRLQSAIESLQRFASRQD